MTEDYAAVGMGAACVKEARDELRHAASVRSAESRFAAVFMAMDVQDRCGVVVCVFKNTPEGIRTDCCAGLRIIDVMRVVNRHPGLRGEQKLIPGQGRGAADQETDPFQSESMRAIEISMDFLQQRAG